MERQIKYYTVLRDGTPLKDKTFGITTSSGSVSTSGSTNILSISNSGTITITGTSSIRILVCGGGAGGAGGIQSINGNHGGGAGNVSDLYYNVVPGTYTVTIGAGGGVGLAGGSSRIVGITGILSGGAITGNSGSGRTVGTETGIDLDGGSTAWDINYFSGGGGGASSNGGNGQYISSLDSGSYGGNGFTTDIRGYSEVFGKGGNGGIRTAATGAIDEYNVKLTNGAGYMENVFMNPGTQVFIRDAVAPLNPGDGGNGGGKTPSRTAAASAGNKGVVIIRYTRV